MNDEAHFCEKCGYQFTSDPKANIPALSKTNIAAVWYILVLMVLALTAFLIYHFHSAATPTVPLGNISAERAEMVRRLQVASAKFLQDQGALVSESGPVLIFQSENLAAGTGFRSGFVWGFKRQQKDNLCALGFRQVRLSYSGTSEDYPLDCKVSAPVPQQSVSVEDRAKAILAFQRTNKLGSVLEQGELIAFDSKKYSEASYRALAWIAFRTNGLDFLCKVGFRQVRFGYGAVGENYSLGCEGSAPSEVQPLLLLSNKWRIEYGYAIMEGQVMNISGQRLENVEAVATFYDAKGEFVTSDNAVIDYNPILPGQKSSYKVTVACNPAMRKGGVEFKYLGGGSIPFVQK
jgi:hypothetical protein